jgi:hypothetical protein
MINERKMATQLLNAVWNEDVVRVEELLEYGADPNWVFNGYPILIHAVYIRNLEIVIALVKAGAQGLEEALGFALDRGIGDMIAPFAYMGVIPKHRQESIDFGPYPARYAPLGYEVKSVRA